MQKGNLKERDYSIDFFKGVAGLSVLYIHTVFWSGLSYVPNQVTQLSLLYDVPVFFFLGGVTFHWAANPNRDPFKGMLRILMVFIAFYLIYALLWGGDQPFLYVISGLMMNFRKTNYVPVVAGSLWFLPVYFSVFLLFWGINKYLGALAKFLLPALGLGVWYLMDQYGEIGNYRLFFSSNSFVIPFCIVFGFGVYYSWLKQNLSSFNFRVLLFLLFVGSIVWVILSGVDWSDLQSIKFPPSKLYIIISLPSIFLTGLLMTFVKRRTFLNWVGERAMFFYLAQGISSSILRDLVPYFNMNWQLKLPLMFFLNLIMAIFFTYLAQKLDEFLLSKLLKKAS